MVSGYGSLWAVKKPPPLSYAIQLGEGQNVSISCTTTPGSGWLGTSEVPRNEVVMPRKSLSQAGMPMGRNLALPRAMRSTPARMMRVWSTTLSQTMLSGRSAGVAWNSRSSPLVMSTNEV